MKVIVNNRPIDFKIDYRFNGADVNSIKNAITIDGVIRHITRIKIYHYVLKNIKSYNGTFMCNIIQNCLRELNIHIRSNIICNRLPEFNKENYRKIINTTYPMVGSSWDWLYSRDNRIEFLKTIEKQCAIEYLSLRKY